MLWLCKAYRVYRVLGVLLWLFKAYRVYRVLGFCCGFLRAYRVCRVLGFIWHKGLWLEDTPEDSEELPATVTSMLEFKEASGF